MTADVIEQTRELLGTAREVYDGDREQLALIDRLELRLDEPLRLAVAGMVKAGKSTLLNAMLGERIAATDTGECTRIVTWYRYSATPTVTMHLRQGPPQRMAIRRDQGLLQFDLGGRTAEEIEWIDVGWPLSGLKEQILIDTPGIASLSEDTSARAARFLTPEEAPSAADAVIYLMRHLHGSDLKFLEAFRDTAAGAAQSVCAVAVLSRCDEVGSGRIDSLLSARRVAARYERDGDLAHLALGVIPVTGLVAEGARTLRESEFIAFRALAGMERTDRERLMVSADRFTRVADAAGLSTQVRQDLLARFGMFGVRLATAIIRGGADSSSALSAAMVEQSGLDGLQEFVRRQFHPRAATLKSRGVILQLGALVEREPRPGDERIRAGIERFTASAHTLRELSMLAVARADGLPLEPADALSAQRILGADGVAPRTRLGLPEEADDAEVAADAHAEIDRWRSLMESPLTERAAAVVCRAVIRSLSDVVSEVGAPRSLRPAPHVDPPGGPGEGAGQDAEQQSQQDKRRLRRQKWLNPRSLLAERDPLR
ncbi:MULTISPECIES: dynamin family protein [unclassified Microbacterium]|uniref:dynamin family protein n=1 Tax=unclassified Microbacterium TaxID=2609290 RepID=UPI0012FA1D17|nr:dynamin family protein [Microbacterium sp. MAH-37]MVQ42600.1 GTP-binding protein [Microbacterium sp. MAH-37]